jgi:uncharacterized membrane protein HdeD (DUF308 family)
MAEPDPIISGPLFATLARGWWVFLLRGVAAVLFGIITLVWPGITIATLVILFGIYAGRWDRLVRERGRAP